MDSDSATVAREAAQDCSCQANAQAPLDVRGVPRCMESGAEIILPG